VNHRAFTPTADVVGWKEDGLAMVKGIDTDDLYSGAETIVEIFGQASDR
jgi:hypothetical protein